MSAEGRPITGGSRPARFVWPSQRRKPRGGEQVAAVCYRLRGVDIEFLLVRTRGSRRWTFPKGGIEAGLTHAQVAALEAFEEAGVHGRMEQEPFTRYIHRKRRGLRRSSAAEITVHAHLCEVSRLSPLREPRRDPTWFSAEKAKRRLQEDRAPKYGAEFARVVDRAVARIQCLRNPTCASDDGIRKVQFEGGIYARIEQAFFAQHIRKSSDLREAAVIEVGLNSQPKVLQFGPAQGGNWRLLEEHTPDYETDLTPAVETKTLAPDRKKPPLKD